MLDRNTIPKFYPPEYKSFTPPVNSQLNNGIQVSSFNSGDQEVFKIELIFPVDNKPDLNPAIPSLCLDMLREGSKMKTAKEINNTLDYYGAFLNFHAGIDAIIITLFGRTVFIKYLIPLLAEILSEPVFDEKAIDKHKLRTAQKLLINEEKTSYWAPRLLRKSIFGRTHAYSQFLSSAGINGITRAELIEYHQKSLAPRLHNIIVAGSYDDNKFTRLLQDSFKNFRPDHKVNEQTNPNSSSSIAETKKLGNTSQASIALGKLTIDNKQPEYATYAFLTKVLGGYFGSRLMKKLREEEGLTYGIHAYNTHLRGGSYFQISADVELKSVDRSIEMILDEINILKQQEVGIHEIDTVKNYMIGEFVNDSNTVFDFAELHKKLLLQSLPDDYYQVFYRNISDTEAEVLKSMANELLAEEQLSIIKVV